jgi:hypothetical protein
MMYSPDLEDKESYVWLRGWRLTLADAVGSAEISLPVAITVRFEDQAAGAAPVDEATLRRVLREELKAG